MHTRGIRCLASLVVMALLLLFASPALAAPSDYDSSAPASLTEDQLYGSSAIVIDADTGEVLFSKNARTRMYPASTTKIMTLLLAVETGWDLDTMVTIPPEAENIPSDSSIVPVYSGETMTFRDLLYGMMLRSGNDAANAVAVLVGGSVANFVERMNARAQELGCEGTHFANAHGYHDENHYTTAQDLAIIAQAGMQNETFREIVSTYSYTMNISTRGEVPITNGNLMLNPTGNYYNEDIIGVKTGYHSRAGYCHVGAASRDGVTLITVTLNCEQREYGWADTERLSEYGFTCYTGYSLEQLFELAGSRIATVRVSNAHEDDAQNGLLELRITDVSDSSYARFVRTGDEDALSAALDDFVSRSAVSDLSNLVAPISMGEIVGNFTYTAQDGSQITATLIAGRDIAEQPEPTTIYDLFPFLHVFDNVLVRILLVVLALLIVVLILRARSERRRRERRRRELYERRRREYMQRQRSNPPRRNSNSRGTYRSTSNGRRNARGNTRTRRRDDYDDF